MKIVVAVTALSAYIAPLQVSSWTRRADPSDQGEGGRPRHVRSELLFCSEERAPLENYEVSKQVKAAMIRGGTKDASVHTLRHAFASRLAARGVPMQAVADLLGQNVATTTARYMHLQPDALRRAMETLEIAPASVDSKVTAIPQATA